MKVPTFTTSFLLIASAYFIVVSRASSHIKYPNLVLRRLIQCIKMAKGCLSSYCLQIIHRKNVLEKCNKNLTMLKLPQMTHSS